MFRWRISVMEKESPTFFGGGGRRVTGSPFIRKRLMVAGMVSPSKRKVRGVSNSTNAACLMSFCCCFSFSLRYASCWLGERTRSVAGGTRTEFPPALIIHEGSVKEPCFVGRAWKLNSIVTDGIPLIRLAERNIWGELDIVSPGMEGILPSGNAWLPKMTTL